METHAVRGRRLALRYQLIGISVRDLVSWSAAARHVESRGKQARRIDRREPADGAQALGIRLQAPPGLGERTLGPDRRHVYNRLRARMAYDITRGDTGNTRLRAIISSCSIFSSSSGRDAALYGK
jgi:hypothetical protein